MSDFDESDRAADTLPPTTPDNAKPCAGTREATDDKTDTDVARDLLGGVLDEIVDRHMSAMKQQLSEYLDQALKNHEELKRQRIAVADHESRLAKLENQVFGDGK